jgi:hypothetical protein
VLDAIEGRLREDLGEDDAVAGSLTASADPVLAELWNNRKDAEYDRQIAPDQPEACAELAGLGASR